MWTKVWPPRHLFSIDFQNNDLTKALHRVLLCLTSISIKVETFSLYQKTKTENVLALCDYVTLSDIGR